MFLAFTTSLANAQFTVNNIEYTVIGTDSVSATDYSGSGGSVIIPDSVENANVKYAVTAIGQSAFENKSLTSVIIPENVNSIGINAFIDNQLTSVIIPNGVSTIKQGAFARCSLTSVVIPDGVTTIEQWAFLRNFSLKSITISESVESIGAGAFALCSLTAVTIPSGVTTISQQAFEDNPISCVISKSANPATITSDVFSNRSTIVLFIPSGSSSNYTTAGWSGFKSTGTIDDNAPFILSATLVNEIGGSEISENTVYQYEDSLWIKVKYNEKLTITGTPRIELTSLNNKYALFDTLVAPDSTSAYFLYVISLDEDPAGVNLGTNLTVASSIDLNGGSIKNSSGNDAALDISSLTVPTGSITNVSESVSVSTFVNSYGPNPSSEELNLFLNQVYGDVLVTIRDLQGIALGEYSLQGIDQKLTVILPEAAGIYIVELVIDNQVAAVRVVKE